MTLPGFLGIGVPKAGTTWLYELLATHPQVFIPRQVKDIRYFNRFYDLGIDWYQDFFPSEADAANYKAIGEFTAHYLYCDACPQRIAADLQRPKLLLMLRNPVDRTWSHYKHRARLSNYQGSFECFLEDHPEAIRFSTYSEHVKRYQEFFDSDHFMVMLFDRVFKDVEATRKQVASFLEIDPDAYPEDAGAQVVNKGYIPRYRSIYALVNKTAWIARSNHLHWPVHLAKKAGVKRLISVQGEQPERMSNETRQELLALFAQDISELEEVLDTDLSNWRE